LEISLDTFEPEATGIDREMPVEVMRDFDSVLLFGQLSSVTPDEVTVRRTSMQVCFPILDYGSIVMVRCYDSTQNPVLLRARVSRSTGLECTLSGVEMIRYKTKRRDVRYPICPPETAAIHEGREKPQMCQLMNISVSGACIVTNAGYEVEQKLCLVVKPFNKAESVEYKCKVKRVTPRSGGSFEYGLRFEHLNRKQRAGLETALHDRFHMCMRVG